MADKTVAFYGFGRFGAAFGERLSEVGYVIRAYDPQRPPPAELRVATPEQLVEDQDIIILAVPVAGMRAAITRLRPLLAPEQVLMDVGSVKTGPTAAMAELLTPQTAWVGTHPLFGPTSLARGDRPLRAVICANAAHPRATERARDLYRAIGCELIEQSPEEHDRFMAEGHALAYFVAKGFIDAEIKLDTPFAPPSVRAIAQTVEAVRADAAHLFASLHRENPFASEARRQLLESLRATDEALRAPAPSDEVAHAEPGQLHIDEAPRLPDGLLETRDLIDELDRELLDLLARRAELSLRAGRAKAEVGREIHDPRREAMLLEERRQLAANLGLDERSIAQVFEAILRFSREHQGRHEG